MSLQRNPAISPREEYENAINLMHEALKAKLPNHVESFSLHIDDRQLPHLNLLHRVIEGKQYRLELMLEASLRAYSRTRDSVIGIIPKINVLRHGSDEVIKTVYGRFGDYIRTDLNIMDQLENAIKRELDWFEMTLFNYLIVVPNECELGDDEDKMELFIKDDFIICNPYSRRENQDDYLLVTSVEGELHEEVIKGEWVKSGESFSMKISTDIDFTADEISLQTDKMEAEKIFSRKMTDTSLVEHLNRIVKHYGNKGRDVTIVNVDQSKENTCEIHFVLGEYKNHFENLSLVLSHPIEQCYDYVEKALLDKINFLTYLENQRLENEILVLLDYELLKSGMVLNSQNELTDAYPWKSNRGRLRSYRPLHHDRHDINFNPTMLFNYFKGQRDLYARGDEPSDLSVSIITDVDTGVIELMAYPRFAVGARVIEHFKSSMTEEERSDKIKQLIASVYESIVKHRSISYVGETVYRLGGCEFIIRINPNSLDYSVVVASRDGMGNSHEYRRQVHKVMGFDDFVKTHHDFFNGLIELKGYNEVVEAVKSHQF